MTIKKLFVVSLFFSIYGVNVAVAEPHWTHEDQNWGAIEDPSQTEAPLMFPFAVCSIGSQQSPVDLAADNIEEKINRLKFNYAPDSPVFFNSGHGIQVNTSMDYPGELKIGKEAYPLIQFHLHEPSEHIVNGEAFPAELHFVHVKENGKIAVLGILMQIGEENATLQSILNNMPSTPEEKNSDAGITIDPLSLLPYNTKDYYSYAGSLTTPPCSEGVDWYVFAEPITISEAQLEQLKSFYTNNARNVQDLKGRSVSIKISNKH